MGTMDEKALKHFILVKHSSPSQSLSNSKNFFTRSKEFVFKYGFIAFKTTGLNPKKQPKLEIENNGMKPEKSEKRIKNQLIWPKCPN